MSIAATDRCNEEFARDSFENLLWRGHFSVYEVRSRDPDSQWCGCTQWNPRASETHGMSGSAQAELSHLHLAIESLQLALAKSRIFGQGYAH